MVALQTTSHTHANKSILDNITEAFTIAFKSTYDLASANITALLTTGNRLITIGEIAKLNATSGANTGDETLLTLQTKRPLKTINNNSLEGVGDIPFPVFGGGVFDGTLATTFSTTSNAGYTTNALTTVVSTFSVPSLLNGATYTCLIKWNFNKTRTTSSVKFGLYVNNVLVSEIMEIESVDTTNKLTEVTFESFIAISGTNTVQLRVSNEVNTFTTNVTRVKCLIYRLI